MSNPFRRKRAEEGGTGSGRASLDADEGQRIQMVAEQAFSPVTSTFDLPATETPEPIPSPPPPPPPPKQQTGGKDRGDPANNEETGNLSRQTSRTSTTRSQPPTQTSQTSPPPPPPPKTNTRPAPPPPRRRQSLKESASSSSPQAQAQAQAQPSTPTQTSPAPPRPPRPISREEKRNSKEAPKPVDPFGADSKIDNADAEDDEIDELDELEETPQVDEETFDATVSRTNDALVESEGEPLSSDESSLLTVSEDDDNEDFAQEERIERSASASFTSSNIVMTPTRQKPNPFRQTNDNGGEDSLDRRRSLEAEGRPKFTGKMSNTPSNQTRVRQSMDVDAFKNLMLTGQASSHPQGFTAGDTLHEAPISRTVSLSDKRCSRDSADNVTSSDYDDEPTKSKPKPPPPKPRAKNRLSQIQTAPITEYSADDDIDRENRQPTLRPGISPSASSLDVHEASINNVSQQQQQQQQNPGLSRRPTAAHRKTPPSPPLTRRQSTHGVNNLVRGKESSPPPPPPRSSAAPAPPPPPPARRGATAASPSQADTPQKPLPGGTAASTSSPAPPPARRSSKRINPSAPKPRQESPSNNSMQPPPPPPPPPPGKRRSIPPGSTPAVSGEDTHVGETAGSDILDDLSRLQAEVDALRDKYGVTSSNSEKVAGEGE